MWKTALVVVVAGLVAGCQDSKKANEENFSTAIQTYLDTRDGLCVGVPGRVYPYQAEHDSPLIDHSYSTCSSSDEQPASTT